MSVAVAGPLGGVQVIDVTAVLLGPYASVQLADMGAEVIKVEIPTGDVMRYAGPYRHWGMSPIFLTTNRNKRSIVLDLKNPAGCSVLLKLITEADVFLHNMRPRAIASLGLTYEAMRGLNPRLIYCNAIGFGKAGRYADNAAYDDVVQGAAGIARVQEHLAGEPQYAATALGDKTSGLTAALAICAALYERERSGRGQELEVPMFEVMVSFMLAEHLYGNTFSPQHGPAFYPRQTSPDRKPYRTADGYISIMVYSDRQWHSFFNLIGRPELAADPKFTDINARTEHINEAYSFIAEAALTRTTDEWLKLLGQANIPAAKTNTIEDLLSDGHLADVGMFSLTEHPSEGTIRTIRNPMIFSETPLRIDRLAPTLGQDTSDVLRRYGYSDTEIAKLGSDGAFGDAECADTIDRVQE